MTMIKKVIDTFNLDSTALIKQTAKIYSYSLNDDINNDLMKIHKNMTTISHYHSNSELMLMDIFSLRRFLDKSYITNAITYTGSAHSLNYIMILVKYFDFKITHADYYNEMAMTMTLDKLNKFIAELPDYSEVEVLNKYLYPPQLQQCIDMSKFPDDFE